MQSNRFTYEMKIKQKQTEYLSTNKIKTKNTKAKPNKQKSNAL